MSKFNTTTKEQSQPNSVNAAGGFAYKRDSFESEVASVVLSSMINGNSYYESEKDRLNRIEGMIKDNPEKAEFLMRAMIYVRNEGNLRSISHFMAVILAENVKGNPLLKRAFMKTIIRVDDLSEILSLWNTRNTNKMLPNSLRRAFKESLETKFDMYQFKKYENLRSIVKLRDVVKISHPSPEEWNQNKAS